MAATLVRRDIWTLEEQGPWHPITEAYARAVTVMQGRPDNEPTSWALQAALHSSFSGDPLEQCQHNCWYFLPWHRIYLYWFERIVRAALQEVPEVSAEVREEWALPYWNYGRGGRFATLPAAFREQTLSDGVTANPLFVQDRNQYINDGDPLPDSAIDPQMALDEGFYSQPPFTGGFGGAVTGRNHFDQDPDAAPGSVERTPHGDVHVEVGGLMSSFETAGLDPVFWMHHANIDRLWVVWLGDSSHENPDDDRWKDERFRFPDEQGAQQTKSPAEVLDTVADLEYTYEDVGAAPVTRRRRRAFVTKELPPEHPPELVGATDEHLELTGDSASVSFPVSAAQGPAGRRGAAAMPERVYLNVEGIEGERNHAAAYGVYLNLPDGDDADSAPDSHYVGNVSFFGIEKAGDVDQDHPRGHGLRYAFDVTDVVAELREQDRWDPEQVKVTFAPLRGGGGRRRGPVDRVEAPSPIRVGRVGLYFQ